MRKPTRHAGTGLFVTGIVILVGLSSGVRSSIPENSIRKRPKPALTAITPLDKLPAWSPGRQIREAIDLCGRDLSRLDLRDRANDLLHADFDSRTRWPKQLPAGFDPARFMENGRNPGLGIRTLHSQGLTGRGIGVAIIDMPLLVEHAEYKNALRFYDEIGYTKGEADMHGCGAASIAVGRHTGVAPDAALYYMAAEYWTKEHGYDLSVAAQALDRLLAVNAALPPAEKIRVVTMESGWSRDMKGGPELNEAVGRALKEGVFFVSSVLPEMYGFRLNGLDRDPLADPDDPHSYRPGLFWSSQFFEKYEELPTLNKQRPPTLLFPMDARTTASAAGPDESTFGRINGWSWVTPYIAGLYALACQAVPGLTAERFWKAALETGTVTEFEHESRTYSFAAVKGVIVNPVRLITFLRSAR